MSMLQLPIDPDDLQVLREAAEIAGRSVEAFVEEEILSLAYSISARGDLDGVTLARDRRNRQGTKPEVPSLAETQDWAATLHDGQTDKAGAPYLGHLERVAGHHERLFPNAPADERHAAWLHDAIEDAGITADDFRYRGYSEDTIAIVEAVTKPDDRKGSYAERIDALIAKGIPGALRVKIADLTDNLDPERLGKLPPDVSARLTKQYGAARSLLLTALAGEQPR